MVIGLFFTIALLYLKFVIKLPNPAFFLFKIITPTEPNSLHEYRLYCLMF